MEIMNWKEIQQWARFIWKTRYERAGFPVTAKNPIRELGRKILNKPWGAMSKVERRAVKKLYYSGQQNGAQV